jgi:hypothetical protein
VVSLGNGDRKLGTVVRRWQVGHALGTGSHVCGAFWRGRRGCGTFSTHDVLGERFPVSRSRIIGKACAVVYVNDHLTRTCWVGGKYHSRCPLPPKGSRGRGSLWVLMFNPCCSPPKLSPMYAGHRLNQYRSEMDERNHRPLNLDPVTRTPFPGRTRGERIQFRGVRNTIVSNLIKLTRVASRNLSNHGIPIRGQRNQTVFPAPASTPT